MLFRSLKFYFSDIGLFRANRPGGILDDDPEGEWAVLEGLVAQHLRAWCERSAGGQCLYYWRGKSGREVDFIVYCGSAIYAIDVTSSQTVRDSDLRALRELALEHPDSRRYLLYRGRQRLVHEDVTCVPCEDFLLRLMPDAFPE